jgi:hypothetical protein
MAVVAPLLAAGAGAVVGGLVYLVVVYLVSVASQ